MDLIDEDIYKCLDELDTLLIQDLSLVGQWQQDEENDEKTNSVQVLHCIHRFLDTNDRLKNNSNLLFILKCVFQKHKMLFDNLDYEQFESGNDLPIEAYSLRKYWKQIYPQLSGVLIENLIQNDLADLNKQFRFSEILEFFLLIERTNFWPFYQQIRKERLIVLSRSCANFNELIKQFTSTLEYEIYLVCNYRYIQNLVVEYSDFILVYSNIVRSVVGDQLDSIKNQTNDIKVNQLLNTLAELNRFDELIKAKSKQWAKLDLPNSVNQKRMPFDWKDYFIKRDYFNFLLNELNKELNVVTGPEQNESNSVVSINNCRLLGSFVNLINVLDRYNLIYVKQLKKSFMVIVEVNINQFIQTKFSRLLKRVQLKQIYLYLNTLYYVKEKFSNYGVDLNKVDELIRDLECEFKAKHLFVLNVNIDHIDYYICYLTAVRTNLRRSVNYNLFHSQRLYQDLVQQALIQLDERDFTNDDLIRLLSCLPDLLMFAYDNENLFNSASKSAFQKIVNKFCWKLLFKITLLNAPLKSLNDALMSIDEPANETLDKPNWLVHFKPNLYSNLPYYHALICNQKLVKHFIFICRPFVEFNAKFTVDLIGQLVRGESVSTNPTDRKYRKTRNRLLKAVFNLITSSSQLNALSAIILPLIENQPLNFDCIQFELLLDDSLSIKHSSKLNQLDWIFGLIKLVKNGQISEHVEIIFNNFLYKYTDLMGIIELDPSIQHLFNKLNLKFFISECYLLDEFTESIFKLLCDSVLLLPNGLFYSLEQISKDLKFNDVLVFNSLTAHILLFAICKQLKSRLKVLDQDSYKIVYSKVVGNLLNWLTFPNDHDLNKYRNKFTDLVVRRRMNLNFDQIQVDENQELESLFRSIEINYDQYEDDVNLLESFLAANGNYLNSRLNKQEFGGELNLNCSITGKANDDLNVTTIYQQSKRNYEQAVELLKTSFDFDRILRLMRCKTNKSFIRTNLIKRSDFSSHSQHVDELKRIFQIT